MKPYFKFRGTKSTDMNILLRGWTPIFLPEKNIRFEDVPGRNGSVSFDDETRRDIIIQVDCTILGKTREEVRANARQAEYWLSRKGQLSFWNEPQRFYIGQVVNQVPLMKYIKYEEMSLLFRCEPFAYFIKSMADEIVLNDDIPICEQITLDRTTAVHTITGPTTIQVENNGAFKLSPHMKIEGSFNNLAIGTLVINMALNNGTLYIDNELQEVYTIEAGQRINKLQYCSGKFLELEHGINDVQISGNNLNFTLYYLSRERW